MAVGPLSSDLSRRLRWIVEAHAVRGMGPAEADVEDALASGRPDRVRAAVAGLDTLYPPELRGFLDHRGMARLYRDDLRRAVDRLEAAGATAPDWPLPGRRRRNLRLDRAGPWLAILLTSTAVGLALWQLSKALPDAAATIAPPIPAIEPIPAPVVPEPVFTPLEPVCRARLKAQALSWCVRSLGGQGGATQAPDWSALADCGDALDLSADTVRLALDRLFEEGVSETYATSELPTRCERAAEAAIGLIERSPSERAEPTDF